MADEQGAHEYGYGKACPRSLSSLIAPGIKKGMTMSSAPRMGTIDIVFDTALGRLSFARRVDGELSAKLVLSSLPPDALSSLLPKVDTVESGGQG